MYLRLHFGLLLLLTMDKHLCGATFDLSKDAHLSASDDYPHPHRNNRTNIQGNLLKFTLIARRNSTLTPLPPSTFIENAPISMDSSTVSKIPAQTTAAPPSRKDASRTINIIFTILLVVTAILMVITGLCLLGLRRRYLDVSLQKYDQLKTAPV